MNVVRVVSLALLISVVGCQQKTTPAATETRPAVRAANGTLYDLNCLKGKKPSGISQCAVNSAVKKAWGSDYSAVTTVNYFVWQISYFDEMSMCQWMFGLDACYNYFGVSQVPGPRCDVGWLYQYQNVSSAQNCGWYWNPQYPTYPQWPTYPVPTQMSCNSIKAQRDSLVQNSNYCTQNSQCGFTYSVVQWGDCNPPATNSWLSSPEADYWVAQYQAQCLAIGGAPVCPALARVMPTCVSGRCQPGL